MNEHQEYIMLWVRYTLCYGYMPDQKAYKGVLLDNTSLENRSKNSKITAKNILQ